MALDCTKNFAIVTVSTTYDASATSIVLSSGHGAKLPDPAVANYNLTYYDSSNYADPSSDPNVEIVRCTAKSTDTITVTRAQESTSATTKNTGGATYKMILGVTAKMITDIDTLKANLASPTFSGTLTVPTGLTGVLRADSGVVSVDTDVTDIVAAASTTAAGVAEIATGAEIDTGTDDTRVASPKGLADQTVLLKQTDLLRVSKTADETVNNSNTYQADDHLTLAVAAATYKFKLYVFGTNADVTPGLKLAFYTNTADNITVSKASIGNTTTEALDEIVLTESTVAGTSGSSQTGTTTHWKLAGSGVFTSSGTITFAAVCTLTVQWAQSTAHASNTTLKKGSYLELTKV